MESKKAGGVEVGRIVVEGSITSTNLSHQYDFLRRERKPITCRVRSHGHIRALVINLRFAAAQRRTIVCGFSHRFSALQLAKRRSCDAGLQSSTFAPSHLRTFGGFGKTHLGVAPKAIFSSCSAANLRDLLIFTILRQRLRHLSKSQLDVSPEPESLKDSGRFRRPKPLELLQYGQVRRAR